jgi:hypothetical protein
MADGTHLRYTDGGMPAIIAEDNSLYIEAMRACNGTDIATDNYEHNRQRRKKGARTNASESMIGGSTYLPQR